MRLMIVWTMILMAGAASGEPPYPPGDVTPGTEYRVRHVLIEIPDDEVVLSGELSLPIGAGPHPAVILITGNGPHTREQIISLCRCRMRGPAAGDECLDGIGRSFRYGPSMRLRFSTW